MEHERDTSFDKVDFNDEGSLRAFIATIMRDKEENRRNAERQAETNIAWYQGYQNLYQHPAHNHLVSMPNPRQRVRLSFNLIKPSVQIRQANIGFDPIKFEVAPATQDMEDWDTARLSTDVLEYYQEYLDVERMVEESDLWVDLSGSSFIQTTWNPDKGNEFDTGNGKMAVGDLEVRVVPLFNIYWQHPLELDDAAWCLVLTEDSPGSIKSRYGKDMPEDSEKSREGFKYWRSSDIDGSGLRRGKRNKNDGMVLVQTLWVKRSKRFPKGKHLVVADGTVVLKNGDNPYKHGRIPVIHNKGILVPNSNLGQGVVDDLLQPQAEFNKAISQMVETRELMANPYVLARHDAIVDEAQWNNVVGGIRYFNGDPPTVVQGAALPSAYLHLLNKTQAVMQDIVGAHDVSQGRSEPGVKSGVAIRALQEKDEGRVGPQRRRRRRSWGRIGQMMLGTLGQFVKEQRLVKILSEENVWETARFTGKNLRGKGGRSGANYFDVRVKSNGSITSKAGQLEMLQILIQNKFLLSTDANDKRLVTELMEFNNIRGNIDKNHVHRQQQRFENDMMMVGKQVPVLSQQNDQIHMDELDAYRNRHSFQFMPQEIQVAFQLHFTEHEEAAVRKSVRKQLLVPRITNEIMAEQQAPAPQQDPLASRNGNSIERA